MNNTTNPIYNQSRFEQAGLRKGSEKLGVPSSDTDLNFDLGDRGFIIVELKAEGTSLNSAQKLMFTRMLKSFDKPSFLIVANHNTSPDQEICPNAYVDEVYYKIPAIWDGLNYHKFEDNSVSLNNLISSITFRMCPRLLNENAQLIGWYDLHLAGEVLKSCPIPQTWFKELQGVCKKIGAIKVAPSINEPPQSLQNIIVQRV